MTTNTTNENLVILNIRRALSSGTLPDAAERPHRDQFGVAPPVEIATGSKLVSQFAAEVEALAGHVHLPTTGAAAVETVLHLMDQYEVDTALSWSREELPLPAVWDRMMAAGITVIDAPVPPNDEDRAEHLAGQAAAQIGLTGAHAGLSDTGSLVLVNGPGRSRLASLLPPVHVALLPIANLLPNLSHLFVSQPELAQQGSNLVVITGPSRTADIELTLTIGVHGPRDLHVVLLPTD